MWVCILVEMFALNEIYDKTLNANWLANIQSAHKIHSTHSSGIIIISQLNGNENDSFNLTRERMNWVSLFSYFVCGWMLNVECWMLLKILQHINHPKGNLNVFANTELHRVKKKSDEKIDTKQTILQVYVIAIARALFFFFFL